MWNGFVSQTKTHNLLTTCYPVFRDRFEWNPLAPLVSAVVPLRLRLLLSASPSVNRRSNFFDSAFRSGETRVVGFPSTRLGGVTRRGWLLYSLSSLLSTAGRKFFRVGASVREDPVVGFPSTRLGGVSRRGWLLYSLPSLLSTAGRKFFRVGASVREDPSGWLPFHPPSAACRRGTLLIRGGPSGVKRCSNNFPPARLVHANYPIRHGF